MRRIVAGLLPLALAASGAPGAGIDLRVEAELEGERPGNLTVTPSGEVVLSMHQFSSPRYPVMRLGPGGRLRPFPSASFYMARRHGVSLDAVLGIQCDAQGVVWMLDNGLVGKTPPQLVGWDTLHRRIHRVLPIPAYVLRADSFANDLAIDLGRGRVYMADPAGGENAALIVMDLETGLARRLLQGHYSVAAEPVDLVIDGTPVQVKTPAGVVRPHLGVNPLALDPQGEWLYFGPMHGRDLYRVRAELLARAVEPDAPDVTRHVEHVGRRPITDGITVSERGTVYLGDLARSGLGALEAGGEYRLLAQDGTRLSWVDAFAYGTDGRVYAVVNRLHETAALSAGARDSRGPFFVISFEPDAAGFPGR